MKKIGLCLLFTVMLFFAGISTSSAQIGFSLNINSQPQWGPANYDHVEYYFLPEYGIYYYAPGAQFVYKVGSRWTYSSTLPYRYRNANLYSTYKVVVNESKPFLRHDYYVNQYKNYRNVHSGQMVIRDSKDERYREINNRHKPSGFDKKSQQRDRKEQQRNEKNNRNQKDDRRDK